MIIRLQDFLISVAVANGSKDHGEWPNFREFIEWFLGNCAAHTVDTACGLFWMRPPGTSMSDYVGINAPSLITRIMTKLYPSETQIHLSRTETYWRKKRNLSPFEKVMHEFGFEPKPELAIRFVPAEMPFHFTSPERRRAFVFARLGQVCSNPDFRAYLQQIHTTAKFGMQFVTSLRLTAPALLIGKSGPRQKGSASSNFGSLVEEAAKSLVAHNAFDGIGAAKEAGVQIIHAHLGGKVSPSMIAKTVGNLDQFTRQAKRRKREESKRVNSGN